MPPFNQQKLTSQDYKLINEVSNYFKNNGISNESVKICLYGECETKQTLLANYFIHNRDNYSYKAWFSAEDISGLDSEYSALGLRLKLFSESVPAAEKRIIMKNWFENNPSWLLVYTNVGDYDELEPYMPSSGGHTIFTSKSSEWPSHINFIDVGKLDDEDCEVNSEISSKLVDSYFPRKKLIEDLSDKLRDNSIAAITGIAGSGKTQLAYYYAYKVFQKKHPKGIADIILCDTKKNLRTTYRDFAIKHLGMPKDINTQDFKEVVRYVKDKLKFGKKKYILIFDNVDALSYGDIKNYLPKTFKSQQQIIITSQKTDFFARNDKKNLPIDGFTDQEAEDFLLLNSNIQKDETRRIAIEFSNLPLGLQCAKLYLNEFDVSVDEYLKLVEEQPVDVEEIESELMEDRGDYENKKRGSRAQKAAIILSIDALFSKKKTEKNILRAKAAKYLLKICSFLHPDDIPLTVLKKLVSDKFSLKDNEFRSIVREYKRCSLILPSKRKLLSMHRMVQKAAKLLMNEEEKKQYLSDAMSETISYFNHKSYLNDYYNGLNQLVPHLESLIAYNNKMITGKKDLYDAYIYVMLGANYKNSGTNQGSEYIDRAYGSYTEYDNKYSEALEKYYEARDAESCMTKEIVTSYKNLVRWFDEIIRIKSEIVAQDKGLRFSAFFNKEIVARWSGSAIIVECLGSLDPEAKELYHETKQHPPNKYVYHIAKLRTVYGQMYAKVGRYYEAKHLGFDEAKYLVDTCADIDSLLNSLKMEIDLGIAECYLRGGDLEQAENELTRIKKEADKLRGKNILMMDVIPLRIEARIRLGKLEEAYEDCQSMFKIGKLKYNLYENILFNTVYYHAAVIKYQQGDLQKSLEQQFPA